MIHSARTAVRTTVRTGLVGEGVGGVRFAAPLRDIAVAGPRCRIVVGEFLETAILISCYSALAVEHSRLRLAATAGLPPLTDASCARLALADFSCRVCAPVASK